MFTPTDQTVTPQLDNQFEQLHAVLPQGLSSLQSTQQQRQQLQTQDDVPIDIRASNATGQTLSNGNGPLPKTRKQYGKSQTAEGGPRRRGRRMRGQRKVDSENNYAAMTVAHQTHQSSSKQPRQRGQSKGSISPVRKQQIFSLLKEVESLQSQIQALPQSKNRHYVDPFVRIGQASNLNLQPQKAALVEKDVNRRDEIQRQAQIILRQIEADRQSQAEEMWLQQQLEQQALCNCVDADEMALIEQDKNSESPVLSDSQKVVDFQVDPYKESQMIYSSMGPLQCEECGHVCVTNTEKTSEAPGNQTSLDLEDEEGRRQHFSPLNSYTQCPSISKAQQEEELGPAESEAEATMQANRYTDNKISSKALLQEVRKNMSGSSITHTQGVKCNHCGSSNVVTSQGKKQAVKSKPHLKGMASERYQDQRASRGCIDTRNNRNQNNSIFDAGKKSNPVARTQHVSTLNMVANGGQNRDSHNNDTSGKDTTDSKGLKKPLKLCDQNEVASVQFMGSKDGNVSTSYKDITQINLKIKNEPVGNLIGRYDQHVQSQPNHLGRISAQTAVRQSRGAVARSRSQSRSKSRRSIKVGDGNIVCGKCVPTTQFKQKVQQRIRIQSAKVTNIDSCPVHSLKQEPKRECPSDNELTARANFTVRLAQDPKLDQVLSESEIASTKNADLDSRKIRDSIEFTSMTHTARQNVLLDELNELDEDRLSEALISEIRAIAQGNFTLAGDPLQVSTYQSEVSAVKSNRINLLSLGAYTVKEQDEFSINAQSNFATNERESAHQSSVLVLHSELGDKAAKSNVRAEANQKASGAYGSEIAYSNSIQFQKGAYPLNQMLVNEADEQDEEEFEEEVEEEMEVELSCEHESSKPSLPDFPPEERDDMLSHATSYSSFYVIDEKEEARLKQVAFEKFMADKAIEQKVAKREELLKQKKAELKLLKQQQAQESSFEVVDQSVQYSKQIHDSREEKVSNQEVPSVKIESDRAPSVQMVAEIEPEMYQFSSNYDDSQYHGIQEALGDTQSAISQSETDTKTIKAFNNQKLYEEAHMVNDAVSVVTKVNHHDQQSTIDLASQVDQVSRQQPDYKSNLANSSHKKLVSQFDSSQNTKMLSGGGGRYQATDNEVMSVVADASYSNTILKQQQTATIQDGSETATVSQVAKGGSLTLIQTHSVVYQTECTQFEPHKVSNKELTASDQEIVSQVSDDRTEHQRVPPHHRLASNDTIQQTDNHMQTPPKQQEPQIEPAIDKVLVTQHSSAVPITMQQIASSDNIISNIDDVQLNGTTPSASKNDAVTINSDLMINRSRTQTINIRHQSGTNSSPRHTRKSTRKSPKPIMVDRSQQDSRMSNHDYITFAAKQSSVPTGENRESKAFNGTVLSSARVLASQEGQAQSEIYVGDKDLIDGDSEPTHPQIGYDLDGQIKDGPTRQGFQALATGDEEEPEMPTIDGDNVSEVKPQTQSQFSAREFEPVPVTDTRVQEDDKVESSHIAENEYLNQSQVVDGIRQEDSHDYVTRMMKQNGVSMMDDQPTDMTFKNIDYSHPFKFASGVTNSQEPSVEKDTASLNSLQATVQKPASVEQNNEECALDQEIKLVQIDHDSNRDLKTDMAESRKEVLSDDLLPQKKIKKDASDVKVNQTPLETKTREEPQPVRVPSKSPSEFDMSKLLTKKASPDDKSQVSKNSQRHQESKTSIRENPLQFSSIREVKSPKAFRIKSQICKGGKVMEKNKSTGRVGRRTDHIGYFAQKETRGVKAVSTLKKSQGVVSRDEKAFSTPEQKKLKVQSQLNQSKVKNIYEQSPRMILAEGQPPELKQSGVWNSNTDANMRTFLTKLTAKRIKQIDKEVESAKLPLFDARQQYNQSQQESEFLSNPKDKRHKSHTINKNAVSRTSAGRHPGLGQGTLQVAIDESTKIKSGVHSLLVSSGHRDQDSMRAYMQSEAKTGNVQFESLEAMAHQNWTMEKVRTLNNSTEDITQINEPSESNFSKQYQNFKSKGSGRTNERRNIKPNHKLLSQDLYFRGQVTSDDDTAANSQPPRTTLGYQTREDAMQFGSLGDSFAIQAFTSSGGLQPHEVQEHYVPNSNSGRQRTQSQSKTYLKLQKSYSTTMNRPRGQSTIMAQAHKHSSNVAPPRKLQFYPQNQQPSKPKGRGIQNHVQTKGSGFNTTHLIHDNQHAPYLRTHLRTTAYL